MRHVQAKTYRIHDIYHLLVNQFGPQKWWPADTPFEVMVGAILTQNTNWGNVSKAIDNIKQADMMAPDALIARHRQIPNLIKPSGFYRLKTQRLLTFCKYLMNQYKGSIIRMKRRPLAKLRQELLLIKGIGQETADSILLYALEFPVFVIDTYTRRIFSRHGYIDEHNSYEEVRRFCEDNLPLDAGLFNEFHALLVKLGKTKCRKNEPYCNTCPLQYIS